MKRGIATAAALAALALAGSAAACAHHAPPPTVRPMLTGSWTLLADSGQAAPTAAAAPAGGYVDRGEAGETPRGGRGRGGERGERGEGGSSRARTYDPEAVQVALAALARGEARVNIVQTDSTVHFDFADGSYFDLAPDGHSGDDVWRNVGRIKSMARWTEGGLLLRRKIEESGVTVDQTYSLPAGTNHLVVRTVVSGPVPRPINQRRVYTLVPSGK